MPVDRKVLARRLELLLAEVDRAAGKELDGALDLPADARWPDLRYLVDREAVRAVMSAPVRLPGEGPLGTVIGTLNVYLSLPHDWDVAEISALTAYADVAASLVAMALLARV